MKNEHYPHKECRTYKARYTINMDLPKVFDKHPVASTENKENTIADGRGLISATYGDTRVPLSCGRKNARSANPIARHVLLMNPETEAAECLSNKTIHKTLMGSDPEAKNNNSMPPEKSLPSGENHHIHIVNGERHRNATYRGDEAPRMPCLFMKNVPKTKKMGDYIAERRHPALFKPKAGDAAVTLCNKSCDNRGPPPENRLDTPRERPIANHTYGPGRSL